MILLFVICNISSSVHEYFYPLSIPSDIVINVTINRKFRNISLYYSSLPSICPLSSAFCRVLYIGWHDKMHLCAKSVQIIMNYAMEMGMT